MIRSSAKSERRQILADGRFAHAQRPRYFGLMPSLFDHASDLQAPDPALPNAERCMGGGYVVGVGRVELKVLDPVVGPVSVDVVDSLIRSKCSTKMLLHHPPMDEDSLQFIALPHPRSQVALASKPRLHQTIGPVMRSTVQPGEAARVRAIDAPLQKRTAAGLAYGCHAHSIAVERS